MNQLATSLPSHPSKKNKILAALGAVVVGHMAVLFALHHMEPMQLKPLTPPKPIQVRLIQPEKPKEKPTPPKPVEPPKPKEVKIVDTPPPPPKKVEQVQQVKKETPKPKVAEPPKPTKVETPTPVVTPIVTKTEIPKPVVPKPIVPEAKPTPVAEPAPVAEPTPVKPPVDMTPRNLGDAAGVAWKRQPKPKLMVNDLEKVTNNMVKLRMDVDVNGKIKASVVESSGNPKVDREMVRAVQVAQFHAYKENGVAVPFYAEQSFRVQ